MKPPFKPVDITFPDVAAPSPVAAKYGMGWRYFQALIRVTASPVVLSIAGVPLGKPKPDPVFFKAEPDHPYNWYGHQIDAAIRRK